MFFAFTFHFVHFYVFSSVLLVISTVSQYFHMQSEYRVLFSLSFSPSVSFKLNKYSFVGRDGGGELAFYVC